MCVCAHSVMSDSFLHYGLQPTRLLYSWGFSRQEYWSGLPCPSPGDLPGPGIEPTSLTSPALAGRFFTTNATQEAPGQFHSCQETKDKNLFQSLRLWGWRRLLRVPWTARRSNQSILKEISPGCSLEGLMLKLKLQYFGHMMNRADSFEKTLLLRKIEGGRRWDDRG